MLQLMIPFVAADDALERFVINVQLDGIEMKYFQKKFKNRSLEIKKNRIVVQYNKEVKKAHTLVLDLLHAYAVEFNTYIMLVMGDKSNNLAATMSLDIKGIKEFELTVLDCNGKILLEDKFKSKRAMRINLSKLKII